jgi:hypothetical protein
MSALVKLRPAPEQQQVKREEVMRTLTASEIDAVAGGTSINTTRSNIKSGLVVVNTGPGNLTFTVTQSGTITTNQVGS